MQKEPVRRATHQGELKIGSQTIPVAILDNKDRVVSIRGMANILGVKGGGAYWKEKKENPDAEMLPEFISAKNIEEYAQERKHELIAGTFPYVALNGQDAVGIKDDVIPKILDIWMKALSKGILTEKQKKVAEQARILLGAFANVGITALIDEATGFQKEKDEYQKILAKYIAAELQPWLKTFGEGYYYQIYRLKGWDWNKYAVDRKNHPWAVANITNRIVYEKLPVGVLESLATLTPKNASGNRTERLHQHLTPEEGRTHLLKHLGAIEAMMEQYNNGDWEGAVHAIDKRFPSKRIGPQLTLEIPLQTADKNVFNEALTRAAKPAKEAKGKKE
jgi:hypothetical protein